MARYDCLILGGGLAGLTVALHLPEDWSVLIATKQELLESNSRYAQGGIAAAFDDQDSPTLHAQDTLLAGAGLCDEEAVGILTDEGPAAVQELIDVGVPFDRSQGQLQLGREGAHTLPRILHAGGDATGAAVVRTLAERLLQRKHVAVRQRCSLVDLEIWSGRVVGAWITGTDAGGGSPELVEASHVVLATGGAGQLYLHTTNPLVATGDGVAAAFRAGAAIADAEFFQFHPTALALPGVPSFLISEAVRGEGGRLLAADGRRFMPDVHPQAELAPRDVVARAIHAEMERAGGQPVGLDVRHIPAEQFSRRFPTIAATCANYGIDPSREPIPVAPAAHYWMGGVWTDLDGRSSLPGLYACGEVACTGIHGANRLASNSLLEALVFGRRVAAAMLQEPPPETTSFEGWVRLDLIPMSPRAPEPPPRGDVRRLMWSKAGLVRSRDGLRIALNDLRRWSGVAVSTRVDQESTNRRAKASGSRVPLDATLTWGDQETMNLVQNGCVLCEAALVRKESRGAHWRSDFPTTDPAWRRRILVTAREPLPSPLGRARSEKEPVHG